MKLPSLRRRAPGPPPRRADPERDSPVLAVRGIRRAFGDQQAVDGIDFEVSGGEIFGLVGPDGAGKTTAMRIVCGILAADAGSAQVAGTDVGREPGRAKSRIGYMSQRFSLYEDLTVAENLFFFGHLRRVPGRERREREAQLLEAFRLEDFRGRLARNLSGGMKQKLALACTLLHRPELLVLDEPTTGVDPVSRREFWRILHRILDEETAILVSTPYMDEAERCHRLALMSEGRVLLRGTPEEMRASMEGEIIEIEALPQRDAREILSTRDDVLGTVVFGGLLHLWVRDAAAAGPRLEQALAEGGVEVRSLRTVPPGLEDVFVSRITGAGGDPQ